MAVASRRSNEGGTSVRPVAFTPPLSIRPIRSDAPFLPPGTSKGLRPATSENTVAASEYTSDWIDPRDSSIRTSGADHGMDMPMGSSGSAPPMVAAIPKSDNTGLP